MTALGLALDHPERVGRMVVAAARADGPPPFNAAWNDRIAATRRSEVGAFMPRTLER